MKAIYFDAGFDIGLIRASVAAVRTGDYGSTIVTLKLSETRKAYKRGELIETSPLYTVHKAPKSPKYPYHQMVRSLSLDEIRAALPKGDGNA